MFVKPENFKIKIKVQRRNISTELQVNQMHWALFTEDIDLFVSITS